MDCGVANTKNKALWPETIRKSAQLNHIIRDRKEWSEVEASVDVDLEAGLEASHEGGLEACPEEALEACPGHVLVAFGVAGLGGDSEVVLEACPDNVLVVHLEVGFEAYRPWHLEDKSDAAHAEVDHERLQASPEAGLEACPVDVLAAETDLEVNPEVGLEACLDDVLVVSPETGLGLDPEVGSAACPEEILDCAEAGLHDLGLA